MPFTRLISTKQFRHRIEVGFSFYSLFISEKRLPRSTFRSDYICKQELLVGIRLSFNQPKKEIMNDKDVDRDRDRKTPRRRETERGKERFIHFDSLFGLQTSGTMDVYVYVRIRIINKHGLD